MTRTTIKKRMTAANILGELRGSGRNIEVELPSDLEMERFQTEVAMWGGFRTGYGAWVLQPRYVVDPHDFNSVYSHHY